MSKSSIREQIDRLKKVNVLVAASAKFIAKDSSNHLPPNEEEDLGLEIIANFMLKGGNKTVLNQN
jgi:hypothetical protein